MPDYELIEVIGRGSYGEVWLARNVVGVRRAVKIVRRSLFDSSQPYEREFTGLQRFEPLSRGHAGVVDILHLGRAPDDSHFYYVMELADSANEGDSPTPGSSDSGTEDTGGPSYLPLTLRAQLRLKGRLPVNEVVELGVILCGALQHLHRHGLLHRDVKPSNVIIVGGQPKLADIGLVTGLHEAKSFVGTEGYIPPEGPGTVSADLYALGKTLYEAATGKNRQDFPELPEDFRGTPDGESFAELNEVLLRVCAPTTLQRYASAEQMRTELLLLQTGRSVRGLRATERLLVRFKVSALMGAGLLIVFAIVAAVQRALAAERATQIRALEIKEEQRRQTAYAADMAIAFQSWELGRAELTRRLLDEQRPLQGHKELRGWEWRYLWAQSRSREIHHFTTDNPYGFWSCAISPDGKTIAGGVVEGFVELWDLQTDKGLGSLDLSAGVNPVDGIRFSRDGRRLWHSLRSSGEVVTWDLDGRLPGLRFGPKRPGLRLALSPDESLIATADGPPSSAYGPGEVRLWLAASGQELAHTALQPTYFTRAEFSPDGKFLGTVGSRGYARIWSVPNLHEVSVLPHESRHNVFGLGFSPSGEQLATTSLDGLIRLWDWRSAKLLALWHGHAFGVEVVRWSPDGTWIATGGRDQVVRLWSATNYTELAVFKGHAARINALAFSPDGRRLFSASEDKTIRGWDLTREPRALPNRTWSSSTFDPELAVSRNGAWLALRTQGNAVELRDTTQWLVVSRLPGDRPVFGHTDDWLVTRGTNQLMKFSVPQGQWLRTFGSPEGLSGTPAVSPDGHLVASATVSGQILLWKSSDPAPPLRLGSLSNRLEGLFFTPSGKELVAVSAGNGAMEWFDVNTGQVARRLATGKGSVTSVALSPDGASVLIGETAARLRLVTLGTGHVERLDGDTGSVLSVAWSPDGQTIAAGSFEGFIKLWNVRTRRELASLRGHVNMLMALQFSSDGRHLVSGSGDGTWRVWSAPVMTDTEVRFNPPVANTPAPTP
jgi:WD40 repeat protein